jgi:hypothetical protein
MLKKLRRNIGSKVLGWKIAHGYAPRGRTEAWAAAQGGTFNQGKVDFHTLLTAIHKRKNPITGEYEDIDRREVRDKAVTTVFVNDIVDSLVAAAYLNDYKYHDSGTGVGAEAAGDTALGTPCGDARDTGTQLEGASANIYKSVATHTYDEALAITEHGLFDAATTGILMDRTVFAAINVVATDQIQFTYQLTLTAGG